MNRAEGFDMVAQTKHRAVTCRDNVCDFKQRKQRTTPAKSEMLLPGFVHSSLLMRRET